MASTFSWLDHDDTQRRRMLAVVELFKEEGTVDELGIGSIRDAIADVLFPGTSVLHTRARYLLFVPWLLERAARHGGRADEAAAHLRRFEGQLIYALLNGGEGAGVIGRQAKEKLKRMPSAAYWAALERYGIRLWSTTVEGYFRSRLAMQTQAVAVRSEEDDPATTAPRAAGIHPDLPAAPNDLLKTATFQLTDEEAEFLRDRLLTATQGTLMSWLLAQRARASVDWVWEHPRLGDFPADDAELVDHARRFSVVIHGAAILYNLLLAEARDAPELVERYQELLGAWLEEVQTVRALDGWRAPDLWQLLHRHGRSPSVPTRTFADEWIGRVTSGVDIADDAEARRLIRSREIQLKGGRARLANPGALDVWRGASGLGRLDYRWQVTNALLDDIIAGLPEVATNAVA